MARGATRVQSVHMQQFQRPTGWLGAIVLRMMNRSHSRLTDWGLAQLAIRASDRILDVGCGGGRTVQKLAAMATQGSVVGIDYSEASVAMARQVNREGIARGQVEIREAPVSTLPFAPETFDLVTAVETHFWWPDIAAGLREIFRVMKPGGRLALIVEFYDGGKHAKYAQRLAKATGIATLTIEQQRAMLDGAGIAEVQMVEEPRAGWLFATGVKPGA